jgi:N-acetylmuramoyl-L-alanine amidase
MLPIIKLISNFNHSPRTEKIKYINIHDVGAVSTAKNNAIYFGTGDRQASADFFVDSTSIIQIVDYINCYSWSVGDGHGKNGITNGNSLSIEMCLEANGMPSDATIANTLDLVKCLMLELKLPLESIIRHFDASGKICPQSFSANNWAKWFEFKTRLSNSFKINIVPKVNYCREFQIWYNKVTETGAPLVVDGDCGTETLKAYVLLQKLIKGEY